MKRLFFFFIIFTVVNLYAQNNFLYSIKLGTYKHIKSAIKDQKRLQFDTYILSSKKFHGLYSGHFKSKLSAKKNLNKIQKYFKDAYITIISSTEILSIRCI